MNNDRDRVRELLKLDFLTYPQWGELGEIVDRNQNGGVFSEAAWTALRDWHRAVQDGVRTRAAAQLKTERDQ